MRSKLSKLLLTVLKVVLVGSHVSKHVDLSYAVLCSLNDNVDLGLFELAQLREKSRLQKHFFDYLKLRHFSTRVSYVGY